MNAIERIIEKLGKYPQVKFECSENSVSIQPVNRKGFHILIVQNGEEFNVRALGWHESFKDEEQALNCLIFLLSDQARLKVHKRGQFAYKYTLQSKKGLLAWGDVSTIDSELSPFWEKEAIAYLQNAMIRGKAAAYPGKR